jgi:hypothetical protein
MAIVANPPESVTVPAGDVQAVPVQPGRGRRPVRTNRSTKYWKTIEHGRRP